MLSSAVSLGVALAGGLVADQMTPMEQRAWNMVQPSVAILSKGGQDVGCAALIDRQGYFLAHAVCVRTSPLEGRLANGKIVEMELKAKDAPTQLVLLKAKEWSPDWGRVASLAGDKPGKGERLLAYIPTGPIKAEYVSGTRVGVIDTSRLMLPLSEIRFEGPDSTVGGALVFNLKGRLLGVLNATLRIRDDQRSTSKADAMSGAAMEMAPAKGGRGMGSPRMLSKGGKYGPGPLTVAYAVTPTILQRVIAGFRSPTHEVAHPFIGAFCVDDPKGARIDSVQPGSPAEEAGLRKDDIIVRIGDDTIRDQVDYGKVMFRQAVGEKLQMTILRNGKRMNVTVRVGGRKLTKSDSL